MVHGIARLARATPIQHVLCSDRALRTNECAYIVYGSEYNAVMWHSNEYCKYGCVHWLSLDLNRAITTEAEDGMPMLCLSRAAALSVPTYAYGMDAMLTDSI